jgi:hypothetical protein
MVDSAIRSHQSAARALDYRVTQTGENDSGEILTDP